LLCPLCGLSSKLLLQLLVIKFGVPKVDGNTLRKNLRQGGSRCRCVGLHTNFRFTGNHKLNSNIRWKKSYFFLPDELHSSRFKTFVSCSRTNAVRIGLWSAFMEMSSPLFFCASPPSGRSSMASVLSIQRIGFW
jgi:hypothetical protein